MGGDSQAQHLLGKLACYYFLNLEVRERVTSACES